MFTRVFWQDALERALKTFAQTELALFATSGTLFNLVSVDFKQAVGVGAGAVVLSLLSSIGSAASTGTDNGSLVR